jgi:DUF1016 N-terminal domain
VEDGKEAPLTVRNTQLSTQPALLDDLRQVLEAAHEQTARAVNSTLVMMYWQIRKRIHQDVLGSERAEYGKEIVATLSAQLTAEYGKGFGRRNLEQMVRFANVFPDLQIAQTLSAQLSWRHFTEIIRLGDQLKRDFYAEMSRIERWRVRTLRHKIDHLLFERTAVSQKPDELIVDRREFAQRGTSQFCVIQISRSFYTYGG